MISATPQKTLDFSSFVTLIKNILDDNVIISDEGLGFYGKATICIRNGKMTHCERHETVK